MSCTSACIGVLMLRLVSLDPGTFVFYLRTIRKLQRTNVKDTSLHFRSRRPVPAALCRGQYRSSSYRHTEPDEWANIGTQHLVLAFWEQCWSYPDNFIMCIYSKLHIQSPNHLTPFVIEGLSISNELMVR